MSRMRIPVDQLEEHELSLEFESRAEYFPALKQLVRDGECAFTDPIRVRLRALRAGGMVEVEGALEASTRLKCARCLAEFVAPLGGAFALTYTRRPEEEDAGAVREKELEAADMGLIHYQGDEIDIAEAVAEQVILSLPLRALCAEDCKGLCAGCGADLNQGPCTCRHPPRNGPFAALRGIKLKQG